MNPHSLLLTTAYVSAGLSLLCFIVVAVAYTKYRRTESEQAYETVKTFLLTAFTTCLFALFSGGLVAVYDLMGKVGQSASDTNPLNQTYHGLSGVWMCIVLFAVTFIPARLGAMKIIGRMYPDTGDGEGTTQVPDTWHAHEREENGSVAVPDSEPSQRPDKS